MRPPELIDGAAIGRPGRRFLLQEAEGRRGAYLLLELRDERESGEDERALRAFHAAAWRVTGYDPGALAPDLRWEADLGVDRVKRLRMIAELARERGLSRRDRDFLEREPGVGGWVDLLCGARTRDAQAPGPAVSSSSAPGASAPGGELLTEERARDVILSVVEEKTGYSRELLELDADLEADLGIDTIKQAQILGALRKHFDLRFREGLRIKDFPTLRHWIRIVMDQDSRLERTSRASVSVPGGGQADVLRQRIVLESLSPPPEGELPADCAVLVTDDGLGVASELKRLLESRGIRAEVLSGDELDSADLVLASLRRFESLGFRFRAVAHLYPLARREDSGVEDRRGALAALTLAKALRPGLLRFLAATGMGGSFGIAPPAQALRASDGAVAGFVKTLALEWPEVAAKVVDLSPGDAAVAPAPMAERLLLELLAPAEENGGARVVEVGLPAEGRLALRLRDAPLDLGGSAEWAIDSDTVVLISGGAQGIGAEIARDLAARHRPALVLLGRTEAGGPEPGDARGAKLRETLGSLESAGARVLYLRCDVSDPSQVEHACAEARARFGAIHAVIHAAGILEDEEIEAKEEESFLRVYSVKVDGARNLARFGVGDETRLFSVFSSVAGRFGNPRQCDYAAANEAASKLAVQLGRDRPGLRCLAIGWGAWDAVGMAARTGVADVLKAAGEAVFAPAQGTAAFRSEILYGGQEGEILLRVSRSEAVTPEAPLGDPARAGFCLLGRYLSYRQGNALTAERVLSASRDRWLKEHTVLENPVMPGTIGIEMMAQAALALFPGFRFAGVRDLRIESGVQLIGLEELPIRVRAVAGPGPTDREREVQVSIEAGSGTAATRACYSATVLVVRGEAADGARGVARVRVDAEGDALGTSAIYDRIRLGPCFHVLSEYRSAGDGGSWGKVGELSPRDFMPEWPAELGSPRFHALPIPLEAGFHSVALARLLESSSVHIPRRIGEYLIHRMPDSEKGLLLKTRAKGPSLFDILICDSEGEVRAEVRDFETLDITEILSLPSQTEAQA